MVATAFGWLGTACFVLSALPQAWKSWKDGHSRGVAAGTIALWLIGELAMTIFTIGALDSNPILLLNYAGNLGLVGLIAWLKVWPRKIDVSLY